MIYFKDDFLPDFILKEAIEYLSSQDYKVFNDGNESYYYQAATDSFINYVVSKLKEIEDNEIINILAAFRLSNEEISNSWKIHSDLIIEGQNPDRAFVLYKSPRKINELHGTALWEHKTYGKSLPDTVTNEEFDRMILKESENLDMWTLNSVIGYEQNRAISYPANYFHSKYPNKSWKSGREVFVMFYKTK